MEWWHYAKNEVKHGPVTDDALRALFADGTLTGANLVWRKGMTDWMPASTVEELRSAATVTMEPPAVTNEMQVPGVVLAPLKTSVTISEQPVPIGAETNWKPSPDEHDVHELGAVGSQRRPWPRLFARSIDTSVFIFVTIFVLAIAAPGLIDDAGVIGFVLLFAWSFVEAAMLSSSGTTPGKALFHIKVLNRDGTKMSYGAALKRSLEVWVKGMAIGVSQLSMFAQGYAYNRLVTTGATSWDTGKEHIVVHRDLSPWKAALGGLLYTGIVALVLYSTISQAS